MTIMKATQTPAIARNEKWLRIWAVFLQIF